MVKNRKQNDKPEMGFKMDLDLIENPPPKMINRLQILWQEISTGKYPEPPTTSEEAHILALSITDRTIKSSRPGVNFLRLVKNDLKWKSVKKLHDNIKEEYAKKMGKTGDMFVDWEDIPDSEINGDIGTGLNMVVEVAPEMSVNICLYSLNGTPKIMDICSEDYKYTWGIHEVPPEPSAVLQMIGLLIIKSTKKALIFH